MTEAKQVADISSTDQKPCSGDGIHFDAAKLENLLRRRFFIAPSFEIYGSTAGLFDFGPSGCAMKNELINCWRRHFVLEDDLMEISGPNLTPHPVLKASGHVDRFMDLMVEDTVTKECFRADKLVEEWLEKNILADKKRTAEKKAEVELCLANLEGATAEQIAGVVKKYDIQSPQGNELSFPYPFNLMFATKIGPKPSADENTGVAYLRPETAQGIFVNFRRLLEQNGGKMPFGAAQVGIGFRNEIAPRNGLLRVREFPMAEIEYFVEPSQKSPYPRFETVKHLRLPLYPRARQMENIGPVVLSLGEAIEQKIIANETLAYFIGRTYLFLKKVGVSLNGIRFRQHLVTEMAHYAQDCWDAELLTSYKWIECVGIADRAAFDLTQHTRATKVELHAARTLHEPRMEKRIEAKANRKLMGPKFKKDLAEVMAAIESLTERDKQRLQTELANTGKCIIDTGARQFELDGQLIAFDSTTIKVTEETYVPNVIEPSFGIGRIIYALLEHSFRSRGLADQEDRNFLALSPAVAPVKCSILPISNQPEFVDIVERIKQALLGEDLSCKVDSSNASIGKRYARTDEIGIPFGITVDFQTLKDYTVTLRELVSMEQVRLPITKVAPLLKDLVKMNKDWKAVNQEYPKFEQQEV